MLFWYLSGFKWFLLDCLLKCESPLRWTNLSIVEPLCVEKWFEKCKEYSCISCLVTVIYDTVMTPIRFVKYQSTVWYDGKLWSLIVVRELNVTFPQCNCLSTLHIPRFTDNHYYCYRQCHHHRHGYYYSTHTHTHTRRAHTHTHTHTQQSVLQTDSLCISLLSLS